MHFKEERLSTLSNLLMEKGLMHKSASEDNKKEGLLQNSAVKKPRQPHKKVLAAPAFCYKIEL